MNVLTTQSSGMSKRSPLPERLYSRFAEVTLELFAHEGSFPLVVPVGQDVETTARAFETLDCAVQVGPRDRWITVTAPQV